MSTESGKHRKRQMQLWNPNSPKHVPAAYHSFNFASPEVTAAFGCEVTASSVW